MASKKIVIEQYAPFCIKPAEITAINSLLKVLSKNPHRVNERYLRLVQDSGMLYVARNAKLDIVGMAHLSILYTPNGFVAWVNDVAVLEDYRGQGIGRRLNKALIARARRERSKHINLTSDPKRKEANRLYRSMGYIKRATNCYRLKF